jgi:hypothetical protein
VGGVGRFLFAACARFTAIVAVNTHAMIVDLEFIEVVDSEFG